MKKNLLAVGVLALAFGGCFVEHHNGPPAPPEDTRLQFDEVTNLGYACGGPLTTWTVTNRQTGDSGNAGCEQPVLFVDLQPNVTYTFDIQGFTQAGASGSKLCWSGSCEAVASAYQTSLVDCGSQIQHLCGL